MKWAFLPQQHAAGHWDALHVRCIELDYIDAGVLAQQVIEQNQRAAVTEAELARLE